MHVADTFRALHQSGLFSMPNPWDRGSALTLQDMGFAALATSSAGHARSLGKDDQELTRDEMVDHVRQLTEVLTVPLNVDSERLYPDDPGGIEQTVAMLAEAGAAGCSIEDFDPAANAIVSIHEATDAVAEAARACADYGLVLTARAERFLYLEDDATEEDLQDTLARLTRFRDAGADVLYAPGLSDAAAIADVVALGAPVNVLAIPGTPPVSVLADLGVRRISTGGRLYNSTMAALRKNAAHFHH